MDLVNARAVSLICQNERLTDLPERHRRKFADSLRNIRGTRVVIEWARLEA